MKQKLLILSLALIGVLGMKASTASGSCGDNLTWVLDSYGKLAITGTGDMYNYDDDEENAAPWSSNRSEIQSLSLPSGMTSIGKYAFIYCVNLTGNLVIPNTVTRIGESAFYGCEKFNGTLTLGTSVKTIEDEAFNDCIFTGTLTIPNSVDSIGSDAFSSNMFSGNLVIPNSVTALSSSAFYECKNFNGTLTLSENLKVIEDYTFDGCAFTGSLVIPNSVKSIEADAFADCNFDGTLTLGDSVTTIGNDAFDCAAFTGALVLPKTLTSLGLRALKSSKFTSITSKAVTPPSLGANVFMSTQTTTPVYVPAAGVDAYKIADGWKEFSNIDAIVVASGTLDGYDLSWVIDEDYNLSFTGTGTTIPNYASYTDAPWADYSASVASLTIPETITGIGNDAFRKFTKLKTVTIHKMSQL